MPLLLNIIKNCTKNVILKFVFAIFFLISFSKTYSQTVTKQLYLSNPSTLDRIDPVATGDNTTSTSPNLFVGTGCSANNIIENFNTVSYTNNPTQWTTQWFEVGDDGTPAGGTVRITGSRLEYRRVLNSTLTQRTANLTGSTCANLSFNWTTASLEESVEVWISTDVLGPFFRLATYTGTGSGLASFNIAPYISANTTIRIISVSANWNENNDVATFDNISILHGTIGNTSTTFTQTPTFCSPFIVKSGAVSINTFANVVSGTMPVNPFVTATLRYGATDIITISNPVYNAATGTLNWAGTIPADISVPAGSAISLILNTNQNGVVFNISYDSVTRPSKVNLLTSTYIDILSHQFYDAPYPGGNLVTNFNPGNTIYVRTVVTDPFGFNDINGLNINVMPGSINGVGTLVANTTCNKTFQYVLNTTTLPVGVYAITATAREGFENTVTDIVSANANICNNIQNPIFNSGLISQRCAIGQNITYVATALYSTSISYSLDINSSNGGNTINSTTGEVTFNPAWTGVSTITATATGCAGPKTATFTVTTFSNVEEPVFELGATSIRCNDLQTILYSATAVNAFNLVYTLDNASLLAGNTINATTGAVTWAEFFVGTSYVTATANGCNGPLFATHEITTNLLLIIDDNATGENGAPILIDVTANDGCHLDINSITIPTPPLYGTIQMAPNGAVKYLPNGNFSGNDYFVYQICSIGAFPACDIGTVSVFVAPDFTDACSEAVIAKTYYMPFPEDTNYLKEALYQASDNTPSHSTVVRNVTSIVAPYPNTIIVYDEWEDGYEVDISNPIQSTTKIWGDGVLTNGIAPGYPSDILVSSASIILDNNFVYVPRNPANIYFDGKDKVYTTYDVAITKVTGDNNTFSIQTVKSNVPDLSRYGKLYRLGLGEIAGVQHFSYAALFINATKNGTVVNIDLDANGIVDITRTLNEGEVWFYQGDPSATGIAGVTDVKPGTVITANELIGVEIVFGGNDNFGTRNINLLANKFYGNTYYTPVASPTVATPSAVYFVNSLNYDIIINWESGLPSSGFITVPANSYNSIVLNTTTSYGYKFSSQDGEAFTAVQIMDADTPGSSYDWAFPLISENRLTTYSTLAWAPDL